VRTGQKYNSPNLFPKGCHVSRKSIAFGEPSGSRSRSVRIDWVRPKYDESPFSAGFERKMGQRSKKCLNILKIIKIDGKRGTYFYCLSNHNDEIYNLSL
jgi:hypothetical protein